MHIEIFQTPRVTKHEKAQTWHWHFKNKGRITADAEAFPSRSNAVRAAQAVVRAVVKEVSSGMGVVFKQEKKTKGTIDTIIRWY